MEEFASDGVPQPPLLTNTDRWQRVIFDDPEHFFLQRMDSDIKLLALQFDPARKTFTLTAPSDLRWKASFTYEDPQPNQLVLDGNLNGRHLNMTLHRVDMGQFLLLKSRFSYDQSDF